MRSILNDAGLTIPENIYKEITPIALDGRLIKSFNCRRMQKLKLSGLLPAKAYVLKSLTVQGEIQITILEYFNH